jgi:hypothetical protein
LTGEDRALFDHLEKKFPLRVLSGLLDVQLTTLLRSISEAEGVGISSSSYRKLVKNLKKLSANLLEQEIEESVREQGMRTVGAALGAQIRSILGQQSFARQILAPSPLPPAGTTK